MDKFEITVNIEYKENIEGYRMSDLKNPNRYCDLCEGMYKKLIGKKVLGKVTFILKKIKGEATDYIFPFRISDGLVFEDLEYHDGKRWDYLKTERLLGKAIDIKLFKRWLGKSKFSIEVEYEIDN